MCKDRKYGKRKISPFVLISVCVISAIAIASYVYGYMRYLKVAQKNMYGEEEAGINKVQEGQSSSNKVASANKDAIDVIMEDIKIDENTMCKEITVNLETNERVENGIEVPAYFVGLNRLQLSAYYDYYMQNIPIDEVAKGLQTINILKFSNEEIVIEKLYDLSEIGYYIVAQNNIIMVYYNDKKTLYENTGIRIDTLPEEEKNNLINGIMIENQDELMAILEGYSS